LILAQSCGTERFLEEDQTFLAQNKIEIQNEKELKNKYDFDPRLDNLVQQEPNTNFFLIPKEYFYYRNSSPGDSAWYNRFAMKYLAEEPAVLDQRKAEATSASMQNYLVNKKGFYNAQVDYNIETKGSKSVITYQVKPNKRYHINSIEYYSEDREALKFLESIQDKALINEGDFIDAGEFDLELTRMSLAMQNEGYANFATNYLSIKGDSSLSNGGVDIFLELLPPLPDTVHQKFTIGEINVYTDFHRDQYIDKLEQESHNGITYHRQANKFLVRPSSIDNAIFLETGSGYNREDRSKTRRKLSELSSYRFVALNPKIDLQNDSVINYDIMLTPFQKRWVGDFGWDFFISSTSQTSNGSNQVFGFSLSQQFQNRNLLGGSELLTLGAEVGLEVQLDSISSNSIIRSRSIGINGILEIPKHQKMLGLTPLLRSTGLMDDRRYQNFKENTKTSIRGGYNFNDLIDNYSRSSVDASFSYDYRPTKNSRFVIRQLGLEFNDYELTDIFRTRIINNPLLLRSFDDNLLTGLFFRDLTYIYNTPNVTSGSSYGFLSNFELSGWEIFLANQVSNAIRGSDIEWQLTDEIEFAKYARLEIDPRYYNIFSDRHSLATRLYAGIIVPFGGSEAAPFFKQFSVGGPNSMRGWDQKELGPGEYSKRLLEPIAGQTFYQTGDIKLEANVEYRFDIFYIFEGALFMDVGNVWTIRDNADRPGAVFTSSFLNQLAVSAGYGVRFDFTYFNIRFDFGYKLRDPFPFENTDRRWYKWDRIKSQGFGNFQVAVNYPF